MFNLIKKDLIVGLKVRSLKAAILTFIVGLFFLTAFSYVFPTLLPIMFTFIVMMNSFYYDHLNKSESFILSLSNKREDVSLFKIYININNNFCFININVCAIWNKHINFCKSYGFPRYSCFYCNYID